MNKLHLKLCSSVEWGQVVKNEILPWTLGEHSLGDRVLEIGPGPGLTTDILRSRVPQLTALELDPDLAAALATRLGGTGVEVVCADATAMPFDDDVFSAATSFTMLHHVPTAAMQDTLMAEVRRVLRPGGLFIGVDSVDSIGFRSLHEDDICNPLDPGTLAAQLASGGFTAVEVETADMRFRFSARKPG